MAIFLSLEGVILHRSYLCCPETQFSLDSLYLGTLNEPFICAAGAYWLWWGHGCCAGRMSLRVLTGQGVVPLLQGEVGLGTLAGPHCSSVVVQGKWGSENLVLRSFSLWARLRMLTCFTCPSCLWFCSYIGRVGLGACIQVDWSCVAAWWEHGLGYCSAQLCPV